jgi:phosphate uptake regulator
MFRFKELIELWRTDNLMTQALNDSQTMLENTREMFTEAVKSLRESDSGEMGFDVYRRDQMVNKFEQDVRRKVLKHLAITGGTNIIPGLVLTSIVIDIERIGDYTKNIHELALAHPRRLHAGSFEEDIQKIEKATAGVFGKVGPALKNSDREAARAVLDNKWWIIKRCDEIVEALVKEEVKSLSQHDAVSTALYARYLKRITGHLLNVTTSIINPFEWIGFRQDDDD